MYDRCRSYRGAVHHPIITLSLHYDPNYHLIITLIGVPRAPCRPGGPYRELPVGLEGVREGLLIISLLLHFQLIITLSLHYNPYSLLIITLLYHYHTVITLFVPHYHIHYHPHHHPHYLLITSLIPHYHPNYHLFATFPFTPSHYHPYHHLFSP